MAHNGEYWGRRMKMLEDALLDKSYAYVENLERQFSIAERDVEEKLSRWYQRLAENNEISLAEARKLLNNRELEEFRWTVEEYIAYGQQNALDGAWMKQLENASARVHISQLEAKKLEIQQQAEILYGNQLDALDRVARETYQEGFYRTAFEVQKGLGVGTVMPGINEKALEKALARPWTADGQTFRDRCWVNKQALVNSVNTQLTQMIIRGEAPDRAIAAISRQFEVSKAKAGRLVMTESAALASAAQRECFGELGVERYKIVASFDEDTCELCGALDGKAFKMSEYQVGLTAPPFHPWCRCCTAPYFEDMQGIGERWSRRPDGRTEKVPADMSFEEWKERFVDGGDKDSLTEASIKGIIKKEEAVKTVKTPEEARTALVEAVGFDEVEASFRKIDDELQVENTNQLLRLEKRFGIIHKSTGTISSTPEGRYTEAYVSSRASDPLKQNLSLCPKYFKDKTEHIKALLEQRASGWNMPFTDEMATVYNVTHEYGHMIQNSLIRQAMESQGWTADNPGAFIDPGKKTSKAQLKWYYTIRADVQKACFYEIIDIAKQTNPGIVLSEKVSKYGKTNYAEFFAEVFANSQCGKPNELGKAMQIWLEKKEWI